MAHYHKIPGFGHEVHSGPPSECVVCHPTESEEVIEE